MSATRRLATATAALALTTGLVTVAPTGPAAADGPLDGLLGLLTGGSSGGSSGATPAAPASTAPSAADFAAWGSFTVPRHKLRKGCHRYGYRYRVAPPTPDWALEVFLTDRRGRGIGSEIVLSGSNPTAGARSFTICRSTTVPGRFLLRGKLTYADYPEQYAGWITPKAFVMKAVKAKKKKHRRHR